MPRRSTGIVLPAVLLLTVALSLAVQGTFEVSFLEARALVAHRDRIETRNAASVLLDSLVARAMERWAEGSGTCALDAFCPQDFPRVERLRARFAERGEVTLTLQPPPHAMIPRSPETRLSSAKALRYRLLEARVRINGKSPVVLAEGFLLPEPSL